MLRKNRKLAKLCSNVNITGEVVTSAISAGVELGGSVDVYSTSNDLPLQNVSGTLALVNSNKTLYFNNGNGWYLVSKLSS